MSWAARAGTPSSWQGDQRPLQHSNNLWILTASDNGAIIINCNYLWVKKHLQLMKTWLGM